MKIMLRVSDLLISRSITGRVLRRVTVFGLGCPRFVRREPPTPTEIENRP